MKIFLAGVEHSSVRDLVSDGVMRNAFLSYWYIRKYPDAVMKHLFDEAKKYKVTTVIDSGAHSFFSSSGGKVEHGSAISSNKKLDITPHEYWSQYVTWLTQFKDDYDYFVELDIGEIVGQDVVLAWREQLDSLGLLSKCLPVYHPKVDKADEFLAMAADWPSRYVALEGLRGGRSSIPYVSMIKACYEAGVRVHGFAMNKARVMQHAPFYSVDSVSWKAAGVFGTGLIASGLQYQTVCFNKPHNAKQTSLLASVALRYPKYAKDAIGVERSAEQTMARNRIAIQATCEVEDALTRYWEGRGVYWKEIEEAIAAAA